MGEFLGRDEAVGRLNRVRGRLADVLDSVQVMVVASVEGCNPEVNADFLELGADVELADQEAEDADEFGAFGEEDSVRGEEGMLVDEFEDGEVQLGVCDGEQLDGGLDRMRMRLRKRFDAVVGEEGKHGV
mgnify:FL=1